MKAGPADTSKRPRRHSTLKPAILSFLAYVVARLLGMTWRFRFEDESGLIRPGTGGVLIWALWHNRIGVVPVAERRLFRRTHVATLVSASRDGELLARVLARFGFTPVRGSTSRRGPQSLLELVRYVAGGFDAVITPDGPRGPAEVVQPGIMQLAKMTEVPITPISCSVPRSIRLKSWDRFIIPWPFAKIVVRAGKPIAVPRHADAVEFEAIRLQLQEELKRLGA